jgi:hypothetical protein
MRNETQKFTLNTAVTEDDSVYGVSLLSSVNWYGLVYHL